MDLERRYPDGPVVVGIANEGGGTRKTTDAVNLGVSLARQKKKVAVFDADQTMAASCYLGYGVTNRKKYPERAERVYARLAEMPNIYHVLLGSATAKEALYPARTRTDNGAPQIGDDDDSFEVIENLYLLLGSRDMSEASDDIASSSPKKSKANMNWLRRAINELGSMVDVVLVDFRGTLNTLERANIGGCDYLIGAVKPDNKDDDTLELLLACIDATREMFEFAGGCADLRHILLNGEMAANRGKFYADMVEEFREYYPDALLPIISECVDVASSVRAQEPIHFWLGPDSKTAQEFDAAAQALALVWD